MGKNSKVHHKWKDRQIVVCPYNGILLSNKTELVIHAGTETKTKTTQLN